MASSRQDAFTEAQGPVPSDETPQLEHEQPDVDAAQTLPDADPPDPSSRSRTRSSLACFMCQKKKIKCTGTFPCANCLRRNWSCRFDAEADGRRKANNRRTVQGLNEAMEQLRRQRQMISGILAIIKAGDPDAIRGFVEQVNKTENLAEIAGFVQGEVERDEKIHKAYEDVDWTSEAAQL